MQDILPKLLSLRNLIETIPFLKGEHESVDGLSRWITSLQAKSVTEMLSEEEAAQIKMDIEGVKSSFDTKILS